MHALQLHIEDTLSDGRTLLVRELSRWDPRLEVKGRLLQVLPPGGDAYVVVPLAAEGVTALNSRLLCLSDSLQDLPDGLYRIHYSVSPHAQVFVAYNHYRVAELLSQVLSKMGSLDYGDQITLDARGMVNLTKLENALLHVWMQLQGAQALGRDALMQPRAEELYRQALAEFNRLFDRDYV